MAGTGKAAAKKKATHSSRTTREKAALAETAAAGEPELDPTLERLIELVDDEDADVRGSAAVVLGALGGDHEQVLGALRRAVKHPTDIALRGHAAASFGRIAPRSLIEDLRPLLRDSSSEVKEIAKRVLATSSAVQIDDLSAMLEGRDEKQRVAAVEVLGARGGPEARRLILDQLDDAGTRLLEVSKVALSPLLRQVEDEEIDEAVQELDERLTDERLCGQPASSTVLVELLEAVASPESAPVLLRVGKSAADPSIRIRAFEGMRSVLRGRRSQPKLFAKILDVLEEGGTPPQVLSAAVDTVAAFDVPMNLEPRVRGLLASEHTGVRRWAIKALGGLDSAPAARAVAEVVVTGDATDREVAIDSAVGTPSGRRALAKVLASLKDEGRARAVANGLKRVGDELAPATIHLLEEAVVDATPEVAQAILDLLKSTGGANLAGRDSAIFDKAVRLKKKEDYEGAADLFRKMCLNADADPEARFHLGVCELKQSPKTLSRGARNDPALQPFRRLLAVRDYPLVERLTKEPSLTPDDLYFLGFALSEGSDAEKGLGGDVLTHVAEAFEDTKPGKMAHNKLKTMGWVE